MVDERDNVRGDGRATCRQSSNCRDIEVAEHRHRDCSWNRSGSENEDVRRIPFALESVALLYAEAVLFVYDDEREFVKGHRVGEQRVRADDKSGRTTRDRELSPFFLRRRKTPDK